MTDSKNQIPVQEATMKTEISEVERLYSGHLYFNHPLGTDPQELERESEVAASYELGEAGGIAIDRQGMTRYQQWGLRKVQEQWAKRQVTDAQFHAAVECLLTRCSLHTLQCKLASHDVRIVSASWQWRERYRLNWDALTFRGAREYDLAVAAIRREREA